MTRSALHPLVTVLMLVAVCPTHAAAQTLLVQVDNDARIPAADLAQMEQVVASSYRAIGVRVIWEHGEVPLDDPRGLRVHLRLLSRAQAERKILRERIGNAVLGQTNRPARLAYIFCHRIVEASMKFAHDYTRILGVVVAHELGHVLLPAHSHSDTGIMKGRANLWAKIAHEFTAEEGEAIRATLLRDHPVAGSSRQNADVCAQRLHDPFETVAATTTPTPRLPGSRIRTDSPILGTLIHDASERSQTFCELSAAIDASDGIVYVRVGSCGRLRACLLHRVGFAGPYRVVTILVDVQRPDVTLMGAIGHELRHAVEVLSDPAIRSDAAVLAFYRRYGVRMRGVLETRVAIDTGDAVRNELRRTLPRSTSLIAESGENVRQKP